jgi:phosphate ABC transporter permease subunit PstA/phosphate ABC transporter phosphate-binding protein
MTTTTPRPMAEAAVGTTYLPRLDMAAGADERPAPQPRPVRAVRRSDVLALTGALVAAVAFTLLVFGVIMPRPGPIGCTVVGYLSFLGFYGLLVAMDERMTVVKDRLVAAVVFSLALLLFATLAFIVVYVFARGMPALTHWNFYTQDMTDAGPLQGLEIGGLIHAVLGTLMMIGIALVLTVPLGLVTAVYLTEFPGPFARFVRTISEAMTALPSIVAGLFIYATFILILGRPKSGLAASLAISVMMLPIIIRAADVVIRLVPASLREASYALGVSRWSTVWHVVLPTSRSGLTTAVILGTARGIGETSPVLLTAGYTASTNLDPTEGPMVSLPLLIFELVRSPQQAMIQRGFGAAAVLLVLVLLLFVIARVVGGRPAGVESPRQRRRKAAQSRRDAARFAARTAAKGGAALAIVGLAAALVVVPSRPAAAADDYVPISGAGSTWSQNALDQWRRNVNQYGMQINYQGTGSSDGRTQFRNGTVDFAVSEIPYGLTDAGVYDAPPDRPYAYMPIVAGGTAFMYNLNIGGHRVTNLRLSGDTLAGIFTGNITRWDDPLIKADNPALAMPARAIVPVVRSDGSGTTAQLATWLSKEHTSDWNNYCATANRPTPCGVTSFYPVVQGNGFVAQAGSLGVAGFVSQAQNEGTITYVEYSYALNTGFPVVKVLNRSGYYVEPTANSVAVALLKARINNDKSSPQYLTQILDGVYSNPDKRSYPLSSYSYMVVPTAVTGSFNESKGNTLGDFAQYFLCEGQQQAPILGYSPLPINLVKAGLAQIRRVPGANVANTDLSKCHNPTFSANGTNTLAQNAPYPAACDKKGPTQCTSGTGGAEEETPNSGNPNAGVDPTKPATPNGSGNPDNPNGNNPGSTTGDPNAPNAPGDGGTPVIDPDTGQVISGGGTDTTTSDSGYLVTAGAVAVDQRGLGGMQGTLMVLAGLVLLLAVVVPPLVSQYLARRSK